MFYLIAYILWILFSVYEGKREAYYFSFKMKASVAQRQGYKINEHFMFTIQRLFVLLLSVIPFYDGLINGILLTSAMMFCFPFFHDGMYYLTRNKLDGIYNKKWWDQSVSSSAESDKLHLFDPIPRTVLACLSFGIACYEIIKMLQ